MTQKQVIFLHIVNTLNIHLSYNCYYDKQKYGSIAIILDKNPVIPLFKPI